jgi:hypothetical protein
VGGAPSLGEIGRPTQVGVGEREAETQGEKLNRLAKEEKKGRKSTVCRVALVRAEGCVNVDKATVVPVLGVCKSEKEGRKSGRKKTNREDRRKAAFASPIDTVRPSRRST